MVEGGDEWVFFVFYLTWTPWCREEVRRTTVSYSTCSTCEDTRNHSTNLLNDLRDWLYNNMQEDEDGDCVNSPTTTCTYRGR